MTFQELAERSIEAQGSTEYDWEKTMIDRLMYKESKDFKDR